MESIENGGLIYIGVRRSGLPRPPWRHAVWHKVKLINPKLFTYQLGYLDINQINQNNLNINLANLHINHGNLHIHGLRSLTTAPIFVYAIRQFLVSHGLFDVPSAAIPVPILLTL